MSDLLARIKQLEDDLSWTGGYKAGRSASLEQIAALKIEHQQLQEHIAQLYNALTLYGQHDEGCSGSFGPSYRCRCGWRDVAAKHGIAERWSVEQPA